MWVCHILEILNRMVYNYSEVGILNQMVLDKSPKLDRVFHALSHPARRAILRRLTDREQNLSELSAPLRMSFPAASKHIRVLERAQLVRRRVIGRNHLCRIEGKPLAEASAWLEGYRQVWEENFQRLDTLLEELKAQDTEPGVHASKRKRQ
jgi:DNA-binding transcriptional ArsR family regulator